MAGYCPDYSMSVNARNAYRNGEAPLSKWTKNAILKEAEYLLNYFNVDKIEERMKILSSLSLKDLKNNVLKQTSWHHTSKKYNVTFFFGVDVDAIDGDIDDMKDWKTNDKKTTRTERRLGTLSYLDWNQRCKINGIKCKSATEIHTDGWIEETDCFYYLYENKDDVKPTLKKKKDAFMLNVSYK